MANKFSNADLAAAGMKDIYATAQKQQLDASGLYVLVVGHALLAVADEVRELRRLLESSTYEGQLSVLTQELKR